jgi:hypothetical protein
MLRERLVPMQNEKQLEAQKKKKKGRRLAATCLATP